MQLTVRDVAHLLNVPEKTVSEWVFEDELPAYCVSGQYHFNEAEVRAWAASHRLAIVSGISEKVSLSSSGSVSEALINGGITYQLEAKTKEAVLRKIVGVMRLPGGMHREQFLASLLSREALASTGIGDGIAVPHVRNPTVLAAMQTSIHLCFLKEPVDFLALDGRPVDTVFTVVAPNLRTHLQLLSRLTFALRDEDVRTVLRHRAKGEDILAAFRKAEMKLGQQST